MIYLLVLVTFYECKIGPVSWRFRHDSLLAYSVGIADWPRLPERIKVGLLRQQKLQERLLLKAARLGDGQQEQVVASRPLEERSRESGGSNTLMRWGFFEMTYRSLNKESLIQVTRHIFTQLSVRQLYEVVPAHLLTVCRVWSASIVVEAFDRRNFSVT